MSLQRHALAAWIFGGLARLFERLQSWPSRMMPPAVRLMQIGSAFWQSRALHAAAQLDLATALGDGEASADDLAVRVGADPHALFRLLRLLAAMGVFAETASGCFRNNRLSNGLRTDRPGNVRALVQMHNSPTMSRPWYEQLENGLRRGEPPFCLAHGQALYAYMDAHPEFDALFAAAMDCVEAMAGDGFATGFDWRVFERVIDRWLRHGLRLEGLRARHRYRWLARRQGGDDPRTPPASACPGRGSGDHHPPSPGVLA